jgi:hypothetical protein
MPLRIKRCTYFILGPWSNDQYCVFYCTQSSVERGRTEEALVFHSSVIRQTRCSVHVCLIREVDSRYEGAWQ